MWILKTRQCRLLVAVLVLSVIPVLMLYSMEGKPEPTSIWKTQKLNATLEHTLKDKHRLHTVESQGATIFVDDLGQVRVPPSYMLELMEFRDLEEMYHRYIESIQVPCTRQVHYGSHQDGGYDICVNPDVVPSKPCTVYSFGVRNDFSFDDAVSKEYGCTIHTFDPANGMPDHQHSPTVHFHSLGIWNKDEIIHDNWKMRTVNSIKRQLGHGDTNIDIMKLDVEGAEWIALPEMLISGALKGVKQLIMEFHCWVDLNPWTLNHRNKEDYQHHLNVFHALYEEGFRIFYFKRFPAACCIFEDEFNISRIGCHEIHLMRIKT